MSCGKGAPIVRNRCDSGPVPFHGLHATLSAASHSVFHLYKGKVLLVNTTHPECGYTGTACSHWKNYFRRPTPDWRLFPRNDFKQQEKGSDADIASFCKKIMVWVFPWWKNGGKKRRSSIPSSPPSDPPPQNGWNNWHPVWNFSKIPRGWTGQVDRFLANTDPLRPPVGRAYIWGYFNGSTVKDEPVAISSFLTGFLSERAIFVVVVEFYRTLFRTGNLCSVQYFIQHLLMAFGEVRTSLRRNL